jgi:hypothetical protein
VHHQQTRSWPGYAQAECLSRIVPEFRFRGRHSGERRSTPAPPPLPPISRRAAGHFRSTFPTALVAPLSPCTGRPPATSPSCLLLEHSPGASIEWSAKLLRWLNAVGIRRRSQAVLRWTSTQPHGPDRGYRPAAMNTHACFAFCLAF